MIYFNGRFLLENPGKKPTKTKPFLSRRRSWLLVYYASVRDRCDMKIFVGNLPFNFNDQSLSELFASYGEVESARVITDRDSGRSRGFGFVEMNDGSQAKQAIDAINGHEIDGRALTAGEARPQEKSGGRGRKRNW